MPAVHCDIDHTTRFDHTDPHVGGRTIRSNGACLCRRHHRLKTAGENGDNGWRVRQLGHGHLEWTTPTGVIVVTEPDGADTLWPEPDLILTTPPRTAAQHAAYRAQAEAIAAQAGLTLAHDTTYAGIAARTPHWSRIEEHLEYVIDAFPPATKDHTPIVIEYDDEPAPF